MANITANGTYGPYQWVGGGGDFMALGTWDGAKVELKYSTDDGVTKGTESSLEADGHNNFNIGGCLVYFVVTNAGASTDLLVQAVPSEGASGDVDVTLDSSSSNPVYVASAGTLSVSSAAATNLLVDDTGTYTYLGKAAPGTATSASSWQVSRVTNATGDTSFGNNSVDFDQIWDNRASLTYA
jgi:hypothetical protein